MTRIIIFTGYGLDGLGIESRWGRDFPPVQTGPGAHPASRTMGTGSFLGVKCGRGVPLTTHPLLAPRSWKGRAIPLLTRLGHNRACNGVTFYLQNNIWGNSEFLLYVTYFLERGLGKYMWREGRVVDGWWRNVQKCKEVKNGQWSVVKCREVKWSDDFWWNVCIVIYLYLCLCMYIQCSTLCVSLLLFASVCYFLITWLMFLMFFSCLFFVLYSCFIFCAFCVFVMFRVLFLLLCCLFPVFVQVYRPLPPGGNPIALNK